MKIFGYIMSNPDEVPVLPDAISSLSHFCDKIFVIDGGLGGGTLNHHPEHKAPLKDVMYEWIAVCQWFTHRDTPFGTERTGIWGDKHVPIILWEHEFKDPAHQRNWFFARLKEEFDQPDWVFMLDSDEVCSWELINGIREYLSKVPDDIQGVYSKWLNLVQDEQHCVGGHHSDWLAHPRIHRLEGISYSGSWHEHMVIDRSRLLRWDTRIIHTRALFRRRLLIQRGHANIRKQPTAFWDDAVMEEIPQSVTWPKLTWPPDEKIIPFDADARDYWSV